MLKQILTIGAMVLLTAGPVSASHWGYSGKHSPEHWAEANPAYSACKNGRIQSPVNVTGTRHKAKTSLRLNYPRARFSVVNNGHTVQATPVRGHFSIVLDGKRYTMKQFHFHTPSEHTFNGRHFPMEAHFVHVAKDGATAVLAVNFKKGAANPVLDRIVKQKLKGAKPAHLPADIDIHALFPKKRSVVRLTGSLTTPPCTEGVKWVIFDTPVSASSSQINAMHRKIGFNNNRPVQPMNGRQFHQTR